MHEHNRNFGFNLSIWDRIFGTYCAQPGTGHQGMTIGLSEFREAGRLTLPYVLSLPIIWKRR
jgi:sterol desaturase/sphingolipid hydroxylase (fatty acid hydroxylase superfamily)